MQKSEPALAIPFWLLRAPIGEVHGIQIFAQFLTKELQEKRSIGKQLYLFNKHKNNVTHAHTVTRLLQNFGWPRFANENRSKTEFDLRFQIFV